MSATSAAPSTISFGADGLVPAVIRDASSGDVLMVAFMNEDALELTRESGFVHFWSRSRQRIWRKGETSGHTQRVEAIFVNCDSNSLLIDVVQTGAVCHDGYPTCFYRRLEPDGGLTTIRDRWFDPADVYGSSVGQGLATLTALHFGAYRYLYDHDCGEESRTSQLLRQPDDEVSSRLADELGELAGAIHGTHRHVDRRSDIALEAGQVLYWLLLRCVRLRIGWETLRPDRALDVDMSSDHPSTQVFADLIQRKANELRDRSGVDADPEHTAADAHSMLHLVAQACAAHGIEPRSLVERDLAELRTRSYLAPYFEVGAAR